MLEVQVQVKALDHMLANAEINNENDTGNPIIKTLVLIMFFHPFLFIVN